MCSYPLVLSVALPFPSVDVLICFLWGKKIGKSQKGPSQLPQLLSCVLPSQLAVPRMLNFHKSFVGRHRDSPKAKQPTQTCQPNLTHVSQSCSWLNLRSPLLLQVDPESGNPHLELLKYQLNLFPAHATLNTIAAFSLRKARSHKHLLEGLCLEKTEGEQLCEELLKSPCSFSLFFLYPLSKKCMLRFHWALSTWAVLQVPGASRNFSGTVLLLLLPAAQTCTCQRSANWSERKRAH